MFLQIDRTDIQEIEIRTNWINPAAIAMVTKQQRGNVIAVNIHWVSGQSTKMEGKAALIFLDCWDEYQASLQQSASRKEVA